MIDIIKLIIGASILWAMYSVLEQLSILNERIGVM